MADLLDSFLPFSVRSDLHGDRLLFPLEIPWSMDGQSLFIPFGCSSQREAIDLLFSAVILFVSGFSLVSLADHLGE